MWTVTVDSNVPIQSINSPPDSGRFTPDKYLKGPELNGDVEELLGSPSPNRSRSSSVRGRPPLCSRTSAALKSSSRSSSPVRRRAVSPVFARGRKNWQDDWTAALENAVDEPENERAHKLNSSLDGVMLQSGTYDRFNTSGSPHGPIKALHDRPMSLNDSDSGTSSFKAGSNHQTPIHIKSSAKARLTRSRSMSRLNGSLGSDNMSLHGSSSTYHGTELIGKSVRGIHSALEDSESRRNVLVHKLKEAQTTLELQSDRLNKIESAAKENNVLVEDLKFKEREYRKKISQLQAAEEDKQRLQMENLRLREEMQDRISALDYQLKSLKTQHHSTENENNKRINLLDHTTVALSLLEEENTKLQQEKEKLQSEIALLKDAFGLTKTRFGALDDDNRNLKNESVRLKEDNVALSKKVQEMAGQMIELRSLLQAVKDENERLSSTWKTSTDDKSRAVKQAEGYQDQIADLKARLSATSADRDRLFQEKLEMNGKIQQMVLDKEQLMKSKLNLEDQLSEQSARPSPSRPSDYYKQDLEIKDLTKELNSVKKVCEELSSELSSVKTFYERALEQVAVLERNKSVWQSQQDLGDQERRRLQSEVDRLSQMLSDRSQEENREHIYQDEMIQKLRSELKQMKYDRNDQENKIQELETKLAKANEGLREGTALQHSELDTWKSTCDRLTSTMTRKESELQNLTDKCHEMEDIVSGLRQEIRVLKDKNEMLSDRDEEAERLRAENRRMLQEKAENEQVMKLLETQKSVLAKNSEDSLNKLGELEHLSGQLDQLRNENEMLRKRNLELEHIREDLVFEKEEALAKSQPAYKSPSLQELEIKMEELRDANKQLREVNQEMSQKLDAVNQENTKMKQAMGSSLTKTEIDKLMEENIKLQADFNNLKHEYGSLDAKHQRFVINYGHDGDVAAKEKQDMIKLRKERDAMQKQVTLLQGQMSLMEGSKKRADEQISKMTSELGEVKGQLKQFQSGHGKKPSSEEDTALRQEVAMLKQQLEKSKENQKVQERMMKNLREESLEDVSTELQQMKGKLQQLMEEIQGKEQTIENLESELRSARKDAEAKNSEVEDLHKMVEDMEGENQSLRQDVQEIRNTLAAELAQEQQTLHRSQSAKSLQEELAEAVKAKQNGNGGNQRPSAILSKSLDQLQLRPASAPPIPSDPVPEKSATEGSNRLQSLISKYRSHSEKDETTPQRVIKPLPGFVSSKIVSKSRFGAASPKAPMRRSSDTNAPLETPISPLAKQEGGIVTPLISHRPAKKLPPPPPPKPQSPTTSGTRSSFMRTISSEGAGKDSVTKPVTTSNVSTLTSLKTAPPPPPPPPVTRSQSLASSGLGGSMGSAEGLNDTQEQKDINALIQKYLRVLET